jgi:D-glycero-D-manno-heptose 1,7-bisphosphate phosphatase
MKLVILDRDGVINEDNVNFIKTFNEWIPIPRSLKSIATLNQYGFKIAIATNQSGIGRGLFDIPTLNTIHMQMLDIIKNSGGNIDKIFYCPHTKEDKCDCRKPKNGMLQKIAKYYNINLQNIPAIGDSLRDLQAYESVGAQPILVKSGKGQETIASKKYPNKTIIFNDLFDAVEYIIKKY